MTAPHQSVNAAPASKPVPSISAPVRHATTRPTPTPEPTPWNPPLIICPRPVDGENGEWILLSNPPICEPEHVYGFVAPPGWKVGDPIPPFKPAPR
jgi:hypothetical protein